MNRKWKNKTTDDNGKSSKVYMVWKSIKHRCTNPKNKDYKNYGARGINICESWLSFDNFYDWIISSNYKEGLQIDRKDNNKGYSPGNCSFVTHKENQLNKRPQGKIKIRGVYKKADSDKYIAFILYDCSECRKNKLCGSCIKWTNHNTKNKKPFCPECYDKKEVCSECGSDDQCGDQYFCLYKCCKCNEYNICKENARTKLTIY